MVKITSSDPRIHLENIKVEEVLILKKLHEREREIRILLSELKALRNIKTQATDLIEEEGEYQLEEEILRRKKQQEEEEEQAQSIDELVAQVQTARVDESSNSSYQSNPATQAIYNLPGEEVRIASDSRSIDELYALIDNPNPTTEQRERLFEITNAVVRSRPYELNDIVSGAVDNTYAALKTVLEKRPDLVSDYKPLTSTSPVNIFLENLKKSPINNYKL